MKTTKQLMGKFTRKLMCSTAVLLTVLTLNACSDEDGNPVDLRLIAEDLNNVNNAIVQPQNPALAGNGRDQSLQFGDVVIGQGGNDLLVGGLGIDVLIGNGGDDIIIGGTEDFNPQNRDRAFGRAGNDTFIWAPGDGSDFFDGGAGKDTVIFGLLGENDGSANPAFGVQQDKNFDPLFLDAAGNPVVNVSGSPGFCTVVDKSTSAQAAAELNKLGLDHLVRFSIRGIADAFAQGNQAADNGLRVTLHLKGVEFLVCTARAGGDMEVLDLTTQPPTVIPQANLSEKVRGLIQ